MAASLAPAGDVNGDGRPDLIIGAPRTSADPNNLTGEAIVLYAPAPEVTVTFDAADVSSNATIELPPVEVGSPISLEVTIANTGFARLTLQNVKGPRGFVVNTPAATTLEALDDTTPQFTLTPTRPGDFSGKLTFKTNDRNEKKFTLNVLWSVNPAPLLASRAIAAPRIDVDAVPDLNNDWVTNAADVALMLRAINDNDPAGDLNNDDQVNADDLILLLSAVSAAQ